MAKDKKDELETKLIADLTNDSLAADLTEEEKIQVEAEARAEVAKELKAEKIKSLKAAKKAELKKNAFFQQGKDEVGEDTELVLITLAPHTSCLTIDGKKYYPNKAYRLGRKLAAVVKDQMYRGELHDAEIHGKNMSEFYGQRPREMRVGPNTPVNIN